MKSLHEEMLPSGVFGGTFGGPTFWAWRTVAKFLDGVPLEPLELELWQKITGREAPPSGPFSEAYLVKPRRAGGTLFAAAVALHAAAQDYTAALGPGEYATVGLIASDRRQARQALNYVKGLIADSPQLSAEMVGETAEGVTFAHRVNLEVHTTSFRSTRGYSYAAVILDELAFFRDDLSANPDVELVRAVRPGLANLGGRLLGLSSPHSRRGHLFEMFRAYYGQPSRVLVIQAGGPVLNPTIDAGVVERARAEDPLAARSDWDGHFREDISQFLTDDLIDRAMSPGTRSRPRRDGYRHVAFADPSGGRKDAFALAIAHTERTGKGVKAVLDRLIVQPPPFELEEVVQKCAEALSAYGLRTVTGDRYSEGYNLAAFLRHGIIYEYSKEDKSAIYGEALPLFAQGMVELLDSPLLETELRLLERRPRSGGQRDRISHPEREGYHDDAANAACGALVLASRQLVASFDDGPSVTHCRVDYDPMNDERGRSYGNDDPRPVWARPVLFLK